jgi:hypothetical protein
MIAPVNTPPSQPQIIQSPELAKLSISSPDLTATPSLKKKAQPKLQMAQALPAPSSVVTGAEQQNNSPNPASDAPDSSEPTQYPKARILPSPEVSPKESSKPATNDQPLFPDGKPESKDQQKPDELLPGSKPIPDTKPEVKDQQKPQELSPGSKPLIPDAQPESKDQQKPDELLPRSKPIPDTKPEVKDQQKPQELSPGSQPLVPDAQPESKDQQKPELPAPKEPDAKQDSKEQTPPPLTPPSEVIPQNPNPLPSGPPPVEPGNYPGNTAPGSVYYNQNYIAPAISFGNDTLIGGVSRFGIGKNISVRPSLFLGNTTRIAVPFTYDFGFNENEAFEKNPLVILHAGGGLDYSSSGGVNRLSPLVVFGADVYLGDGASVLLQLGNTFNSNFTAIIGVGLQF